MSRTLSVVFVATVLLLTSAATAGAECAWVLWWNSAGTWEPIRTWPTRQKCEEDKPHGTTALEWRCLPDTVDPRGPKGAAK